MLEKIKNRILKNKKQFAFLFLLSFIIFFIVQNQSFLDKDTVTRYTDGHIIRTAKYYDSLVLKNYQDLSFIEYPPFLYLVTQVFFVIKGISTYTARFSLHFFTIIFLLSMFGIGYRLGGYYAGAAVLAISVSSPHILKYSKLYFTDFPQTAMTALAFYLLLKTDFFRDRRYSILFGSGLALAFLTKWSTGFFMIIPVLWYFFPLVLELKKSIKSALIFFPVAAFSIGGTIWFFNNLPFSGSTSTDKALGFFGLFILLPGIVCSLLLYITEYLEKKKNPHKVPSGFRLNNFAFMSIVFSITSGVWYYPVGETMKFKFLLLTIDTINYKGQSIEVTSFLRSLFTVFPLYYVFILIGLILIFVYYKDNFYRNLLLPVNFVFITVMMLIFACPGFRYLLSFIIFAAALGGFWIARAGKYKIPITVLLLLLSLFSIVNWHFLPESSSFFSNIQAIVDFRPDYRADGLKPTIFPSYPPYKTHFETAADKSIKHLFNKEDSCRKVMVIQMEGFEQAGFSSEFYQFEVFRITKKIQTDFEFRADMFLRETNDNRYSCTPLLEPGDITESFLIKVSGSNDPFSMMIRENLSNSVKGELLQITDNKNLDFTVKQKFSEELNKLLIDKKFLKEKAVLDSVGRDKIMEIMSHGTRHTNNIIVNRKLLDNYYSSEIRRKYNPEHRIEWAALEADGAAIFHHRQQSPDPVIEEIKLLFPGADFSIKSFDIGDNFLTTTIKIR